MLIDGGSTLNLVSSAVCKDLNLQVKAQAQIKINLPNGEKLLVMLSVKTSFGGGMELSSR